MFACVRREADEKFKEASIKTLKYASDLASIKEAATPTPKRELDSTVTTKNTTSNTGGKTQRIKRKKANKTQKLKKRKTNKVVDKYDGGNDN